MAQKKIAPNNAKNPFAKYPWLWAVTRTWSPKSDWVEVKTLTASVRKTTTNGKLWYVYQQLKDGKEVVRYVGEHSRQGATCVKVTRYYAGVVFLIELILHGPVMAPPTGQQIILYKVPQGPRGMHLEQFCDTPLK
ncbi:MAG: hypothetical protein Q7S46_07540 [Gallionella sp.]|nr:hypothetical protein [Gallionella sp.]